MTRLLPFAAAFVSAAAVLLALFACATGKDVSPVIVATSTTPPIGQEAPAAPVTLAWQSLYQSGVDEEFPKHFSAPVGSGVLLSSVLPRREDNHFGFGFGLAFVPAPVNPPLVWRRAAESGGAPQFPRHFVSAVGGGSLVVSVLAPANVDGTGDGLAFVNGTVDRLDWASLPQNVPGGGRPLPFPIAFGAPVAGGTLITSVLAQDKDGGDGLAFVPATVTSLAWSPLEQSGLSNWLAAFHFKADVPGGTLVLSVFHPPSYDRANGVGLEFVPHPSANGIARLDWEQARDTDLSAFWMPWHFRATVPGGGLFLSVPSASAPASTGAGLAFVPGG